MGLTFVDVASLACVMLELCLRRLLLFVVLVYLQGSIARFMAHLVVFPLEGILGIAHIVRHLNGR